MNHRAVTFVKWLFLLIGMGLLIEALFGDTSTPLELTFLGLIFASFSFGISGYNWWWTKKINHLKKNGQLIYADFQKVEKNRSIQINGRNPFRVIAQWHDTERDRILVFRSANIWFDPTTLLQNKQVPVYVDVNNSNRYYVDLSLLPEIKTSILN